MAKKHLLKRFYVYAHYRKDTGQVFYIGKGIGERAYEMRGRSSRHVKKLRDLNGSGINVGIKLLRENMYEPCAFALEAVLIAKAKQEGHSLVNISNGSAGHHTRRINDNLIDPFFIPDAVILAAISKAGKIQRTTKKPIKDNRLCF